MTSCPAAVLSGQDLSQDCEQSQSQSQGQGRHCRRSSSDIDADDDSMAGDAVSSSTCSSLCNKSSASSSAKRKKIVENEVDSEVADHGECGEGSAVFMPKMAPILTSRTLKLPRLSSSSSSSSSLSRTQQFPPTPEHRQICFTLNGDDIKNDDDENSCCDEESSCGTPKGEDYMIPTPVSCPNAPRKPRPCSRSKAVLPNFFVDPDDLERIFRPGASDAALKVHLVTSCNELARLW